MSATNEVLRISAAVVAFVVVRSVVPAERLSRDLAERIITRRERRGVGAAFAAWVGRFSCGLWTSFVDVLSQESTGDNPPA